MLRRHDLWHLDDHELRIPATVFRLDRRSLLAFLDRLVGLEFDSKIVRITAEADGIARVALNKLPVK